MLSQDLPATSNAASTRTGQIAPSRIAFIGGGNMAEAIIAGLIRKGHPLQNMAVAEPMAARRDYLAERYPCMIVEDNLTAAAAAHVVVLAVKPSVVPVVLDGLRATLRSTGAVVLSIAAGVRLEDMARWLAEGVDAQDANGNNWIPAIVRCMPNTPALVGHGAAGVYASASVSAEQRASVANILDAVSEVVCWVDKEAQLDAVTAVSGSGPAYFFLLLEAMTDAGVATGLPRAVAARLAAQTCLGSAHMALQSEESFSTLRERVTSPNGTTYAAITHMQKSQVPERLREAVVAAAERSAELGEELGKAKI